MGASNKGFKTFCTVFMVITCLVGAGVLIGVGRWVYLWGNHDNICFLADIGVEKNWQFRREGFTGSGTINDPYVLANLVLNVESFGISICGTSAYFVITNCVLNSGSYSINLEHLAAGTAKIVNNTFNCHFGYGYGIKMIGSPGTIIANNTFQSGPYVSHYDLGCTGIDSSSDNGIIIADNVFVNLEVGVEVSSDNAYIENNYFLKNERALNAYGCNNLRVIGNHYFNNSISGIFFHRVDTCFLQNNSVLNNTLGLTLQYSNNVTIRFNQFQNNLVYGVKQITTTNSTILALNYSQAYDLSVLADHNYWYDLTYDLGNYWSDLLWNATTRYTIDPGSREDYHPLENPIIFY